MAAMSAVLSSPSCSTSSLCFGHSRRTAAFCCSSQNPQRPKRQSLQKRRFSHEPNNDDIEVVSQKRFPGRGRDDSSSSSSALKSFGMQNEKGLGYELKEQQVNDMGNLQDASFLNAVVKVYCTHTAPDYSLPWQKQRQFTSTGSAFMIGEGKLLTNAHCVEHDTQVVVAGYPIGNYVLSQKKGLVREDLAIYRSGRFQQCKILMNRSQFDVNVPEKFAGLSSQTVYGVGMSAGDLIVCVKVKVKRRGDDTKFVAKVLARGIECDIALLSVESEEFWRGAEPLRFGRLPCLQDAVTVVGYPLGGDTISVTKGVVSRIEVTSYAHGASDLLGIQIDAAINPGNSGGPAFNDQGECIGVAFQVLRSEDAENIGYVIPTTVVSHFLSDYERNGKYTGFPSLGVLLQKLENPALRACLKVPSNEGVLVRRVEPTSAANNVLNEGDVIVNFDGVPVGSEGTVPFRSTERIAFRYLISQKFAGDVAEVGIIRNGASMKVQTVLQPRVHLVPYHIEGGQPSYFIIAGLVFTPLSEPLIEEECEDTIGLKLLAKARYSLARFKGEEIVILSQVLANEVNIGYEDMGNQQVVKLNGTQIKNIRHLAHLVDSCKDKYMVFEFEDNFLVVLEREAASTASPCILKDYGIPCERSSDLLEPYIDAEDNQVTNKDEIGDSPVSNLEIGFDGLLWA